MLYKYQRINTYFYDLLINNEFYFATPNELNDPMDCNFNIVNEGDENDWRNWLDRFDFFSSKAKEVLFQHLKKNNFDENILFKKDNNFDQVRNSFGITCFGEKKDNLTMWSHYADSHKGVCIGFEPQLNSTSQGFLFENLFVDYPNDTIPRNFYPLTKVDYMDSIPEPYNNLKEPPKELFKFVKTKHTKWSDELEHRLIIDFHLHKEKKYKFQKQHLKEVTFGMGINASDKELIQNLVNSIYSIDNFQVDFFQERKSGYDIVFDKF